MRGLVAIVGVLAGACSYSGRPLEGDTDARPGADAPPGTPDASVIDAPPGTPDATPVPDAEPPLICPPNYNIEFNGHRYKIDSGTWFNAEVDCEGDGTHLIVINSFDELFGYDLVTTGDVWLGMSDLANEGSFVWITNGSAVSGGWKFGEPSDSGNNEDCGSFVPGLGGGYNDDVCTRSHTYACECDGDVVASTAWCVTNTDTACDECGDNCTLTDENCSNQNCN